MILCGQLRAMILGFCVTGLTAIKPKDGVFLKNENYNVVHIVPVDSQKWENAYVRVILDIVKHGYTESNTGCMNRAIWLQFCQCVWYSFIMSTLILSKIKHLTHFEALWAQRWATLTGFHTPQSAVIGGRVHRVSDPLDAFRPRVGGSHAQDPSYAGNFHA